MTQSYFFLLFAQKTPYHGNVHFQSNEGNGHKDALFTSDRFCVKIFQNTRKSTALQEKNAHTESRKGR